MLQRTGFTHAQAGGRDGNPELYFEVERGWDQVSSRAHRRSRTLKICLSVFGAETLDEQFHPTSTASFP